MSEFDPADLLPNDRVKRGALEGTVTQLHRGNQYGSVGDTFEVSIDESEGAETAMFELTDVTPRTLGDLTDADAKREGSPSLSAYKDRMISVHGGHFEWDDDAAVVRHRFERV